MGSHVVFKDFILALNPELHVDIYVQNTEDRVIHGNIYGVFNGMVKDLPSSVMKSISELSVVDVNNYIDVLDENDVNTGNYGHRYISLNVDLQIYLGPVSEGMGERLEKEFDERRE